MESSNQNKQLFESAAITAFENVRELQYQTEMLEQQAMTSIIDAILMGIRNMFQPGIKSIQVNGRVITISYDYGVNRKFTIQGQTFCEEIANNKFVPEAPWELMYRVICLLWMYHNNGAAKTVNLFFSYSADNSLKVFSSLSYFVESHRRRFDMELNYF